MKYALGWGAMFPKLHFYHWIQKKVLSNTENGREPLIKEIGQWLPGQKNMEVEV